MITVPYRLDLSPKGAFYSQLPCPKGRGLLPVPGLTLVPINRDATYLGT